ncbi:MAG: hypothetical protein GF349_00460 [Candidatus Magasanikbacteria bacterium]|nr:hypothetical protein [Candidatus Magasanikbacteria bacterium]
MYIVKEFYKKAPQLLEYLKKYPESFWIERGRKQTLELFKKAAVRVPAYKDFLKKNKIDPEKIKSFSEFEDVPTMDKENYLRNYKTEDLCWDGNFGGKSWTVSATSGSTGEPFYFPRTELQNLQYALTAELYLLENFQIDKKSTLYINCFGMGVWIGGVFTLQALDYIRRSGRYKLSIITPGTSKSDAIKAVKKFGKKFDQVIIGGYPPLVKDLIDEGLEQNIDWKGIDLGFIFSAEGFPEDFRDYIIQNTGIKDVFRASLNHYGTVDLGTMSHETPVCVLIRKMARENKDIYNKIFYRSDKVPTLTQYIPEMFFFEKINNTLACSAFSGLPLVRYDLKDHGGIITLKEIENNFRDLGVNLFKESKKNRIQDSLWKLPFVYVYEREDFTVTIYGLNVYPETIRSALQAKSLENYVSGKFTMVTKFDNKQNQFLEINVELKGGVAKSVDLNNKIGESVLHKLLQENSEYSKLYSDLGRKAVPRIVLYEYEDPKYFKPQGKQQWVKK